MLVFPLYLTVILLTALQLSRMESLATAALSAMGILIPTLVDGRTGDVTPAVLLAVVLMVAAVAITEVVHSVRLTAAEAQRTADAVIASEERMRTMLEAAMVGFERADDLTAAAKLAGDGSIWGRSVESSATFSTSAPLASQIAETALI